MGLSGVRVVARTKGLVRNRRDPSAWPLSGKDRSYKPMVKASGGQRESDGVVVPVIGVRSMKRARARVKALTGRSRGGTELQDTIAYLNSFLRGWGNYFRTGNSSDRFVQLDRYVAWRLKRLLIKRRGRNVRAGQADRWAPAWFHDQGLHKLMGTIRYPKAA